MQEDTQEKVIQEFSAISQFLGFSKGMGAIFGFLYLSPAPRSLEEIVERVGITKGAVSTNIRALERLGLVRKQPMIGERRDFYAAEPDLWRILVRVLEDREKNELERTLSVFSENLALLEPDDQESDFTKTRMKNLVAFFTELNTLFDLVIRMGSSSAVEFQTFLEESDEGSND